MTCFDLRSPLSPPGNHYTWRKVSTTVHNMIVGKLWLDNHGEMEIVNHKTGDKCCLKFIPYSYFSREIPKKVEREGLCGGGRKEIWILMLFFLLLPFVFLFF